MPGINQSGLHRDAEICIFQFSEEFKDKSLDFVRRKCPRCGEKMKRAMCPDGPRPIKDFEKL